MAGVGGLTCSSVDDIPRRRWIVQARWINGVVVDWRLSFIRMGVPGEVQVYTVLLEERLKGKSAVVAHSV